MGAWVGSAGRAALGMCVAPYVVRMGMDSASRLGAHLTGLHGGPTERRRSSVLWLVLGYNGRVTLNPSWVDLLGAKIEGWPRRGHPFPGAALPGERGEDKLAVHRATQDLRWALPRTAVNRVRKKKGAF